MSDAGSSDEEGGSNKITKTQKVIGVVAIMWVAGHFIPDDPKTDAISHCKRFVTERMRAPSTTSFPWSDVISAYEIGGGNWTVRGHVDSENGFGAKIRAEFTCMLKIDNGATTLEHISII